MDNKQPSSIFVPDEVVADIILRLHLNFKPLFRLKLVSKQWNSIISDPTFGQHYLKSSSSSSSSSLHRCVLLYQKMMSNHGIFRRCDHSLYLPAFPRSATSYTQYTIVASSNGLILSQFPIKLEQQWEFEFLVSNPLTKQSVKLPPLFVPPSTEWAYDFTTRACLQGGFTYKLVFIETKETVNPGSTNNSNSSTIRIFSSDTGSWSGGQVISCPSKVFKVGRVGTFTRKGIVHWFDQETKSMITYDPYSKLDRFCCIKWPSSGPMILVKDSMFLVHCGDEDLLKFGYIEHHNDNLCVMDYDKGEWLLEKTCPIDPRWQYYKKSFLPSRKKLVTLDSCNIESFWHINEIRNVAYVTCDSPSKGRSVRTMLPVVDECRRIFNIDSIVPIELSPWSSPLYFEDGSNSSSILGMINIFPLRLPSF